MLIQYIELQVALELSKFAEQNPQNEKFEIESQFPLNLAIFKANFHLIVQMLSTFDSQVFYSLSIVDNIWSAAASPQPFASTAPSKKYRLGNS